MAASCDFAPRSLRSCDAFLPSVDLYARSVCLYAQRLSGSASWITSVRSGVSARLFAEHLPALEFGAHGVEFADEGLFKRADRLCVFEVCN